MRLAIIIISALMDARTRGRRDVGLGDAGTRGRGYVWTRGRRDVGTWGLRNVGTSGYGDVGLGDAGTWERRGMGTRERVDSGTSASKDRDRHLNFALNLQFTIFGGQEKGIV